MIRKRLNLAQSQVIFLVVKSNKIYGGGIMDFLLVDKSVKLIYENEKDEDGFLYLKYSGQEYVGW